MKKIVFSFFTKAILSLLLLVAAFTQSKAIGDADPNIAIVMYPALLPVGDTGVLEIRVDNWGQTTNIKTNSLDVLISIGGNAEILGLVPDSSNTNWTMTSLTTGAGNTIHFSNTNGPVIVLDSNAQTLWVLVKAAIALPVPVDISGRVNYLPGGSNVAQGNVDPTNDNGVTSLYVIPNPLPVTLSSFTANALPGKCAAQLVWTTGEEKNFDHFTVQSSTDGIKFAAVGEVKSNGNVMGSTYAYTADQPANKTYYRLQMVDKDGSQSYSKVVVVNTNCNGTGSTTSVSVVPNPTHGTAIVSGLTAGQRVLVHDMLGQQHGTYPVSGSSLAMDMSSYAAGVYVLSVVDATDQTVTTLKLVKTD